MADVVASRLVLGGGGIGAVWGATSRDEAIATVRAAVAAGILRFDLAPLYGRDGEAERVVAAALDAAGDPEVRISTKCMLGPIAADEVADRLRDSLAGSRERLGGRPINDFVLHGYITPDGWSGGPRSDVLEHIAVSQTIFGEAVVPAMRALIEDESIERWGFTAAGHLDTDLAAIRDHRPALAQIVVNAVGANGNMRIVDEQVSADVRLDEAAEVATEALAIRVHAAGSLTSGIDRVIDAESPEQRDFDHALPFRQLAADLRQTPAALALRYALSVPNVSAVIIGVKNRGELEESIAAERAGPLTGEILDALAAIGFDAHGLAD